MLAQEPLQVRVEHDGFEVRLCSDETIESLYLEYRATLAEDWVKLWSAEGQLTAGFGTVLSRESLPSQFSVAEIAEVDNIPNGAQVTVVIKTSSGDMLGFFDIGTVALEGDWSNPQNVDPSLTCEDLALL